MTVALDLDDIQGIVARAYPNLRAACFLLLGVRDPVAAGAWLLTGLYGINKNNATPSWCLWACAFTAALWMLFYFLSDVKPVRFIARPLGVAGQNVLLAYLLSEMLPSAINLFNLGDWYGHLAEPDLLHAVVRSAACAAVILCATAALNRIGFRLRL